MGTSKQTEVSIPSYICHTKSNGKTERNMENQFSQNSKINKNAKVVKARTTQYTLT